MRTITTKIRENNESIALDVYCTAVGAGLDPSTDGSADGDEPIRLTVYVGLHEHGRSARTHLSVAALGQTLTDALTDRSARYIAYPAHDDILRTALDRVAPAWRAWAVDAECQLESEDSEDREEAWLDAISARSATVFGCGS